MVNTKIIFCANEKHYMIFHPEQPGRVLRAELELSKKYEKVEKNKYKESEVIKFLTKSGHSIEHLNIIKSSFFPDVQDSAYSTGINSYNACIEESKCLMTMCDLIKSNKLDVAINMIRPPGHHCNNCNPAGFCLINTAIAASINLLEVYDKVSILDIDLHHGGGTQKMAEKNKNLMYVSIHNKNVWTDKKSKNMNLHIQRDRLINVALPGQSNDNDYLFVLEYVVKEMAKFSNEILVLSAGIDAHRLEHGVGDKKSHRMNLTSEFYGKMGNILKKNFKKIFVILEGGYNEVAICESFDLMIQGFMGKSEFNTDDTELNKYVPRLIRNLR